MSTQSEQKIYSLVHRCNTSQLSKSCLQNRKVRHHTKLTETDMEFTTFGRSLIDLYEYVIDFPLDQGTIIVHLLSLLVLMMMLT